jgi:hypothetical protein
VDGTGAETAEAGVTAAGDAMEVNGGVGGAGDAEMGGAAGGGGGGAAGGGPQPSPATVFRIRLKQPPASLRHKMRVPELCRNFRWAWVELSTVSVLFVQNPEVFVWCQTMQ